MAQLTWKGLFIPSWILMICCGGAAYNLDTKFAVIFNGTIGSYFGYTVALHRNKDGPMALVGAPRSNSTVSKELHQPGVLFRCDIPTKSPEAACREVDLDIMHWHGDTYWRTDDMWLGVSLDIQQDSSQNDIVTCSHLWKNPIERKERYTNGLCYVIDSDLDSARSLQPLINTWKVSYSGKFYFYYAYGQAGTSAVFSEDGKKLLLGAPGIHTWKGSVVSYPADPGSSNAVYENPTITHPSRDLPDDSYLGYSATSGRFFNTNEVLFAFGAPRDYNNYGQVYIFKERNQNGLAVHQKKEGTQFGEYFGASVLGVDLNGDSLTDLLVGAPFHSSDSGGDEGKVYVYLSKNGVGLEPHEELLGGAKVNARFGTAIANAGDLNQDGYNDVAIGAPYEDEKGAVYIYHGSKSGVNVNYVQRIQAVDIDSNLKGFGIHISRGLDIDGNNYPDILVGAYESSNAVLLRTHPVIQLYPKLIFNPSQININVTNCDFQGQNLTCVNVSACLRYKGKHAPPFQDFENEISVETRGFFAQEEKQTSAIGESINLAVGDEQCIERVLYIRSGIRDVFTPIPILFRYRLANTSKSFDKKYPVIDPSSPTNFTNRTAFQRGCDAETGCLSNLTVTAKFLGSAESGQLTLGEMSSVSLEITVINKGDPAYLPELLIYLPPDLPIINGDSCASPRQQSNASFVCDLGNALFEDREVKILIKLDATKIPTDRKRLDIFLEAQTVSREIAPEDNKISIPLHLQAISDISITGRSSEEQIFYDEDEDSDVPIPITHSYIIRNHGPSPLKTIDILLHVPVAFISSDGRVPFLTFRSLESESGQFHPHRISATCNDTSLNLKEITPEENIREHVTDTTELGEDRKGNSTKSRLIRSVDVVGVVTDSGRDFEENLPNSHSGESSERNNMTSFKVKEKMIVIKCGEENIECIPIQCSAKPFSDIRKVAQIAVTFQVNVTTLNHHLGLWKRAEFITTGRMSIRDTNVEQSHHSPNYTEVKSVFVHGRDSQSSVATWIIVVSVGLGILVLIILILALIRCGFFKRKLKKEMKDAMAVENKQTETVVEHEIEDESLIGN